MTPVEKPVETVNKCMNKRLFPTVMGDEKRNSLNFSTGKPKIEKNMTDLRLLFLRTLTNVRVYGTLV